jgi:methyltransferase-like protein/2-polyprenyl-3-methyl-5-hydroxy-6-metoxy-1,4-benzoquinol methylase
MPVTHHNYDEVPYPDLCYAHSHPSRLAALATLLGLEPTPVANCRVLELGCAGGGNLIPMAYGLPDSTFVGIDNAQRQIETAQTTASALNLGNITFKARDILDIGPELGQFDYIIAHGVYSWVPDSVRDKVLAICQQNLTPNGVAYVSYNTLPGWHMLLMVREMMLYHTRDMTDPMWQVRESRNLIDFILQAIPNAEESAYAAFLRRYQNMRPQQLSGHPVWQDAALLHDELETINHPVYFHQFMDHAAQHGLQYLAEADFPQVMPNDLHEETIARMQQMARSTIEQEQYLDFIRNQTFRRTLLVHADAPIDRTLRPARLENLYLSSRMQPLENTQNGVAQFQSGDGARFSTDHPLTQAAWEHLSAISPQVISFRDLIATAAAQIGQAPPKAEDVQMLGVYILQGFSYSLQLILLQAHAPDFIITVSEKPLASALARLQAQSNPIVSNLRHERVELDGLSWAVLPLLDGQHDQPTLRDKLMQNPAVRQRIDQMADGEQELTRELPRTLHWLSQAALLMG